MLDDANVLKQRDPGGALEVATLQYNQVNFKVELKNLDNDGREINNIVVAGMGGSALAACLAKSWLKSDLLVPLEIVRTYDLPEYAGKNTLVIASSYSGNTEETLSCLDEAQDCGSQIAIITTGGRLLDTASQYGITYATLPSGMQPRMGVIYNLRALVAILANFGLVPNNKADEIAAVSDWLCGETARWASDVPTDQNYAKQLAMGAVGKSAVFLGGPLTAPVAYKFKISWNENAKNVAFYNELPEFNHNEFLGWTSHPIEKPYAIFDVVSSFEHPRVIKRFEITDKLLSGLRPKATTINLMGDTPIAQMLWGSILADFVSIYVAILNGVDPTPVNMIEKLKQELA